MEVRKVMCEHPCIIDPESTVHEAAEKMREFDCGVLPVGSEEKAVGMITDRDIVIRALANGKNLEDTKVKDIMTPEVVTCYDDDTLETATDTMRANNVSRLLVVSHQNKILGIVSFARLLRNTGNIKESDHVVHHLLKKSTKGSPPIHKDEHKSGKKKAGTKG